MRHGNWIQTWSGRKFWPLDPRPDDVFIEDIANALSKICRFNGHCSRFYSVAEHSYHVSMEVNPENALAGLLHDAAEAYLSDIPTPIKPYISGFSKIEGHIMAAVHERFGIYDVDYVNLKYIDSTILADEADRLMKRSPYHAWHLPKDRLNVGIMGWKPTQAAEMFLLRFNEVVSGQSPKHKRH